MTPFPPSAQGPCIGATRPAFLRLLLLLMLPGVTIHAEPLPATTNEVATAPESAGTNDVAAATNAPPLTAAVSAHIDAAHRHMSGIVYATGAWLDQLLARTFGAPPYTNAPSPLNGPPGMIPDAPGGSRVLFAPAVAYSEEDGVEFRGRFYARVDLPHFKNRVQVIVLNIQEDEDVTPAFTDPISRQRRVSGDNDKATGVRFVLVERLNFDLSGGAGLRFTEYEPVPKVRARARLKFTTDKTRYEVADTGFWQSDEGFGQKTEATVAHAFTPRFSVRNTGAVLIRESEPGVEFGETLAMRYALGPRRSAGVRLGVTWQTEPVAAVDTYAVRLPYRQGLWRPWLALTIEPGADFPNEDDYDIAPVISVGLEITIGAPPRL